MSGYTMSYEHMIYLSTFQGIIPATPQQRRMEPHCATELKTKSYTAFFAKTN